MADFKQAVEWMKEGRKVKRCDNFYLILGNNEIIIHKIKGKNMDSNPKLDLIDIDSTNWEIYEEPIEVLTASEIQQRSLRDLQPSVRFIMESYLEIIKEKLKKGIKERIKEFNDDNLTLAEPSDIPEDWFDYVFNEEFK